MKAVVVKVTGEVSIQDLNGWNDIKEVLDGAYLEALPLGEDFTCYIDEDGKEKRLPQNPRAEKIIRTMLSKLGRTLLPGDFIVGPAVFVGVEDTEEDIVECDLPDHVFNEYFRTLIVS